MRSHRTVLSAFAASVAVAVGAGQLVGQTHARSLSGANAGTGVLSFGASVAVNGSDIFVSRLGQVDLFPMPGSEPGSVHHFVRSADGYMERSSVTAPNGEGGTGFGKAIAAGPGILVVGAPSEDDGRGRVYVYQQAGAEWTMVMSIQPDGLEEGDEFGSSIVVSEDGSYGLIGAPGRGESGSVFAYFQGGGIDLTEVELTGSDAPANGRFGSSLSLADGTALVGAPGPFSMGGLTPPSAPPQPGVGYVLQRSGYGFEEVARVEPANPELVFGLSATLLGGEAFFGAPMSSQAQGRVYRYQEDADGQWNAAGTLAADAPAGGSFFGYSLARAGNQLLVGSPGTAGFRGGAVVMVMDDDGSWGEEATLTGEVNGMAPFAGHAVGGAANLAVVGAPGSEFFSGIGLAFQRDDDGSWGAGVRFHEEASVVAAVTGAEQLCSEAGTVAGFPCSDVELVSYLPVGDVGAERGILVNDLWGWVDPRTNREYAILGRLDGTSFIDVTDAENPLYIGNLPLTEGSTPSLWRDMKVHANHVFVVADNAGEHGIQIFDLTRLRDTTGDEPQEFTEDAHYDAFHSAHNIVINEESGFAYVVGASGGGETCGGALHMVNIQDPRNPEFAGCFADATTGSASTGYTHDAQCVIYQGPDEEHRGKEICFNASETALGIADVSDKDAPAPISVAEYPNVAYAHQGWLTEDHSFFYLNDELDELSGGTPGTRTLVWDVEDLDEPVLAREFVQDNPASDHNLYISGNLMYQSNYVSGLRIFDISDPVNPLPAGHFDTVPGEDVAGFAGSWSNYPFFPSGNVVVSSMREGLFVLRKRETSLVP